MQRYLAGAAAFLLGVCLGLIGFVVFIGANMAPLATIADTAPSVLLVVLTYAFAAIALAHWDIFAARIFSVTSSLTFFTPLALLFVLNWSEGHPVHWLTVSFLLVVGLVSPLINLALVRIVGRQSEQANTRGLQLIPNADLHSRNL